jgi:hypothetical protein
MRPSNRGVSGKSPDGRTAYPKTWDEHYFVVSCWLLLLYVYVTM